jgi:hypothetical protein
MKILIIVLEKVEQERILTENYTRDLKRGDVTRILELLVAYGATRIFGRNIHIGTNKLPKLFRIFEELSNVEGFCLKR